MTLEELERLNREEIVALMQQENLEPAFSLFATIHHQSDQRPDGFTGADLDDIAEDLSSGDVARWRRELAAHFAKKRGG